MFNAECSTLCWILFNSCHSFSNLSPCFANLERDIFIQFFCEIPHTLIDCTDIYFKFYLNHALHIYSLDSNLFRDSHCYFGDGPLFSTADCPINSDHLLYPMKTIPIAWCYLNHVCWLGVVCSEWYAVLMFWYT